MACVRFLSAAVGMGWLFPAGPARAFGIRVEQHRLSNGTGVLLHPVHTAPVTTFQVLFKCGSRDEVVGTTGISHLLEHLMFDGSERFPGSSFDRLLEAAGGSSNGYTWTDVTAFMETFPPAALPLVLDLEADRARALALGPEVLEQERGVVAEERRWSVDNDDDGAAWEALLGLMFQAHPYRNPVIGWMGDIQGISLEQVQDWYRRCYAPANALIVLSGDFAPASAMPALEAAFGGLEAGRAAPHPRWDEPPQQGLRQVELLRPVGQPSFLVGYVGPAASDPALPALELLDRVLSGGRASVLVDELVYGQELLAEVDTMLLPMDGASLILVRGLPAAGVEPAAALAALEACLARVRAEPQAEARLARARRAAELSLVQELEGVESSADLLGTWELFFGGWERLGERPARWAEVGPEALRAAAERWLAPERRNVVLVLPAPEPAGEEEGS